MSMARVRRLHHAGAADRHRGHDADGGDVSRQGGAAVRLLADCHGQGRWTLLSFASTARRTRSWTSCAEGGLTGRLARGGRIGDLAANPSQRDVYAPAPFPPCRPSDACPRRPCPRGERGTDCLCRRQCPVDLLPRAWPCADRRAATAGAGAEEDAADMLATVLTNELWEEEAAQEAAWAAAVRADDGG